MSNIKKTTISALLFISLLRIGYASEWETFTNMNYMWEVVFNQGKLWCATTGGVVAFDLQEESVTKFTNVDGLGGNQLYCVAKDTLGNLWFGARNGTLTKYQMEKDSWRVYIIERDKKRLEVKDIVADGETLWIASSDVVSLFLIEKNQGEIKETYQRFDNITPDSVNCITVGGGRIWVGTDKGMAFAEKDDPRINLQDPTSWFSLSVADSLGLTNDFIRSLVYFQDNLYLGTDDGAFKFVEEDSSFEHIGLGGLKVNDFDLLNQDLIAATSNGVYLYTENYWLVVPWEGMSTRWINSLDQDPSGNLWAGTAGKGISSYDGAGWSNYSIDGPPGNTFKDLALDQNGGLWCANHKDEASSFDGTHWNLYKSIIDSIVGQHYRDMVAVEVDKQGNVWFGGWEYGVFKILRTDTADVWFWFNHQNTPLDSAIVGAVVNDIFVDEEDNKWFANSFAVDTARVLVLSPDSQWVVFTSRDGLVDNITNQILIRDGHLWGCFGGTGLCDYDYNGTISYKGDDNLKCYGVSDALTGAVKCVNIDKRGNIWAGTSEGLFRFNQFDQVFERVSLPSDLGPQVNAIQVDSLNNKWIATIYGLGILNDLGFFTDSLTTKNSKLCDDEIMSLAIDAQKGEVWIGTENGLSRFEYPQLHPNKLSDIVPYPNPVIIKTGEEKVSFSFPPYGSRIKIFTVAGEFVKEITFEQNWKWDLRNRSGNLVSGGIYLFLAYDGKGNNYLGKIAVIRE
jgi:ligand-binding sensor domain-containing protein